MNLDHPGAIEYKQIVNDKCGLSVELNVLQMLATLGKWLPEITKGYLPSMLPTPSAHVFVKLKANIHLVRDAVLHPVRQAPLWKEQEGKARWQESSQKIGPFFIFDLEPLGDRLASVRPQPDIDCPCHSIHPLPGGGCNIASLMSKCTGTNGRFFVLFLIWCHLLSSVIQSW